MKQENERAPVKYRRKSLISEQTLTHKADKFALSLRESKRHHFICRSQVRDVWSGGLIARARANESCSRISGNYANWSGRRRVDFFSAAGTCGSSPPSASAANTRPSAPMLMFHSALIAAHNGRLCKSAASPCAASYLFSRHFLSSDMPRGVGGRREFEIYEVLPLSRQRNVFPLAQIAMRNADWLRLFYIRDIYSPRL
jgi:hypothetical protein